MIDADGASLRMAFPGGDVHGKADLSAEAA